MDDYRKEAVLLGLVVLFVGCDGTGTSTGVGAVSENELIGAVPESALADGCSDCDEHGHGHRRAVRGVLPNSAGKRCSYGTSDEHGDVALGFDGAWDVYDRHGTALSTISGGLAETLAPDAFPRVSGFQTPFARPGGPHSSLWIGTWSVDGTEVAEATYGGTTQFSWGAYAPIPSGGVFTTSQRISPSFRSLTTSFKWFDEDGNVHGTTSSFVPTFTSSSAGGALDAHGHTMAFFPSLTGSGTDAQWFDEAGTARGASFPSPLLEGARTSPLIGGGFAVRVGDNWIGVVATDDTQLKAAPHWLARRPRTQLVILGHGDRYALLLDDGGTAPPSAQVIELRSRHGGWLGDVVVPPPAGTFQAQQTRIGRDGTLVQLFTEIVASETQCSYRFWSRALR